ncbi:hypothetical protein K502DRAFT_349512 [Neoconidiobolus thromboides FSU 785]|nr:hypothetical protein K502DRAFT_349512 [Neoconidiobolus thromboides FSU 785]
MLLEIKSIKRVQFTLLINTSYNMFKFYLFFLLSLYFVTGSGILRAGVKLGTEVAKDLAHRYVVGKMEDQVPKAKTDVPKVPTYNPTKQSIENFDRIKKGSFGKRWVKKITNRF